jgi:hypothetical protein
MKKLFLLFTAVLILTGSFATSSVLLPKTKATEVFIPIGNTGKKISLMELSTISMDNLQTLTGRKMNFAERVSFKITQKKLRKSITSDGTIENKKLEKLIQKRGGDTGFHLGGFALGFLLGLIGVLIAYLIHDEHKRNRVKWAWLGLLAWIVIWLIIVAAS